MNRTMGRVHLRTSYEAGSAPGVNLVVMGPTPLVFCKDVIPWEFLLLFSQGYDSAAFSAAAFMAGMIMGAGPTPTT